MTADAGTGRALGGASGAGEIQVFLNAGMDGIFSDHPDIAATVG
ncbi:hypothetical protein [Microbacterium neungamense]|nr:hypothetical protein [Microbacterium neungamense]